MEAKDSLSSINQFKWVFTLKGLTKYCSSVFHFSEISLDAASASCRKFWRPQEHSFIRQGVYCINTWLGKMGLVGLLGSIIIKHYKNCLHLIQTLYVQIYMHNIWNIGYHSFLKRITSIYLFVSIVLYTIIIDVFTIGQPKNLSVSVSSYFNVFPIYLTLLTLQTCLVQSITMNGTFHWSYLVLKVRESFTMNAMHCMNLITLLADYQSPHLLTLTCLAQWRHRQVCIIVKWFGDIILPLTSIHTSEEKNQKW